MPATSQAQNSVIWLKAIIQRIAFYRERARRLALAYYRLARALRTGYSVAMPGEAEGETTLGALRDEFDAVVDEVEADYVSDDDLGGTAEAGGTDTPAEPYDAAYGDEERPADPSPSEVDDEDAILLEEIKQLEDEIAAQEEAAEAEAAEVLDQLGIESMLSKLEALNEEKAQEADDSRAEIHDIADKRQSAAAARISMNAARGLAYSLADIDTRIIGWARFSTSGSPCGWCAMLISRGVVYKTRKVAGSSRDSSGAEVADQDKYHDNCRCVAVPVFLQEQFDSPLFDQNREMKRLWDEQVAGAKWKAHVERDADNQLSVWRRFIRRRNGKQNTPRTAREAA